MSHAWCSVYVSFHVAPPRLLFALLSDVFMYGLKMDILTSVLKHSLPRFHLPALALLHEPDIGRLLTRLMK